jgi:hypothetical protein
MNSLVNKENRSASANNHHSGSQLVMLEENSYVLFVNQPYTNILVLLVNQRLVEFLV